MKAIMVMFDSLRRGLLPCYGAEGPELPNFRRLAERTAVFDNAYVCSLPCMPARKELHTGRPNLLHRSWGPIEPFEDSMPELLRRAVVYTHLVTDHFHYLQDGGATYHERYSSWECFRGQENDKWAVPAMPEDEETEVHVFGTAQMAPPFRKTRFAAARQNDANRARRAGEDDYPQNRTFEAGLDFIERSAERDNWFLQIETFDPHEPFDAPRSFDPDSGSGPDWPPYAPVREPAETVERVRDKYAAMLRFCDRNLGRILDAMDRHDLWKDTMLIGNTDHGFFLGEHAWWGKGPMPDYQELVHVPLFLWDPRCGARGVRRSALVQTIDLAPTLLEFFGQPIPPDMTGRTLAAAVSGDAPLREYALMGYFGCPLTITDGRYLLMRAVTDPALPVYEYTLMPTHMNALFSVDVLRRAQLAAPFSFTKGCPLLRIPAERIYHERKLTGDLLFDLACDPEQREPLDLPDVRDRLLAALKVEFDRLDAPPEQYARYGLHL